MILTTHAITGAAIAHMMPGQPVAAIAVALVSHFVLDTIPHWDYKVYSRSLNPAHGGKITFNKYLLLDLIRICGDGLIGLGLALLLFPGLPWWLCILAAGAAQFPDALHFVYTRIPRQPFVAIQKFHSWIHAKHKITDPVWGPLIQVLIVLFVYQLAYAYVPF